jgi:phosphonate transport system permease protein
VTDQTAGGPLGSGQPARAGIAGVGAAMWRRLFPPADPRRKTSLIKGLALGLVLAILIWSWDGAEMKPIELFRDSGNMLEFIAGFFPPNFHDWDYYLDEMVITFQIAVWGTALAILFAIPLGLMCAANISPLWLRQPMRRLMDAARAINEMVFAMLFVVAVGLGPFAGVLALFVHTTGILAKLFSEAVESIDPRPVEGIRATGANVLEEIFYGVIPQVLPLWISYSLYRFESNVRAATVVGLVGAGGIGVVLWESVRGFMFPQTCAILIIIILACTAIDLISAQVRRLFI